MVFRGHSRLGGPLRGVNYGKPPSRYFMWPSLLYSYHCISIQKASTLPLFLLSLPSPRGGSCNGGWRFFSFDGGKFELGFKRLRGRVCIYLFYTQYILRIYGGRRVIAPLRAGEGGKLRLQCKHI